MYQDKDLNEVNRANQLREASQFVIALAKKGYTLSRISNVSKLNPVIVKRLSQGIIDGNYQASSIAKIQDFTKECHTGKHGHFLLEETIEKHAGEVSGFVDTTRKPDTLLDLIKKIKELLPAGTLITIENE